MFVDLLFFILLLFSLFFLFWLIYLVYKKRWKSALVLLAAPFVLYGAAEVADELLYRARINNRFDAKVRLGGPLNEYHSKRTFHGDGYSIWVYELPASIKERFEAADERLLAEFPKKPSYRNHWDVVPWRQAPLDPQFNEFIDFSLDGYWEGQADSLEESAALFEAMRSALSREGTYCGFFHYSQGGKVHNIDLFIVDLIGNRLYVINHNT